MQTVTVAGVAVLLASLRALAQQQQPPVEGARELYYLAASHKDALPPIRKAAAPAQQKTPDAPAAGAGVVHLGLRYNLVLVNADSGKSEDVDPDRTLRTGECFAIDIESNRSGYLYVLAKQSSGSWQALLPSPEMTDESNIIDPGKKVRIPASYCFEIHDPPGTETLFVVFSRDPKDFYDLYQGIRRENAKPSQPASSGTSNPVQMASASTVNNAVARMSKEFGTRDIAIRKVSQSTSAQEPAHSVYVVNNSNQPTASLVTQILVRHR
jgi:hypothetical protein